MKSNFKILTTYWFLGGLVVLILNDFLLKDVFANWFTGKLSDFAGLFIFPVFWSTIFPKNRIKIYILTAITFIFWKSNYSQGIIDLWNENSLLTVTRIVDYTDLIALIVLPIAFLFEVRKKDFHSLKIRPIIPILFSAFAFTATSYYTQVDYKKSYEFDFPKDTLKVRFDSIDTLNYGAGIHLTNSRTDTVSFHVPCDICFDGMDAKVVVENLPDQKSRMTLLNLSHDCPKNLIRTRN